MFKELTARIAQLNEELNDELNEDFDVDSGALEEPYEYNSYIDDNDEFEEKEELGDLEDDFEEELDDDIDDFDDLDGLGGEDIEDVEESDMLDEDIDLLIESFLEESESFDTLEEDTFIDSLLDENVAITEDEETEFDFNLNEDTENLSEMTGLDIFLLGAISATAGDNVKDAKAIKMNNPEFKEAFKSALNSITMKAEKKKLVAVTNVSDLGMKEKLKAFRHHDSGISSRRKDITTIDGTVVLVELDNKNRVLNVSAIFKDKKDKIKIIRLPIRKFYNIKSASFNELTEDVAMLIAEDALFEELVIDMKKFIIQDTESIEEGIEFYNLIESILNEGIDDKRVHDRALELALAETNMEARAKGLTPVKNKSALTSNQLYRISGMTRKTTVIEFSGQVLALSSNSAIAGIQDLLGRSYLAIYTNRDSKISTKPVKMRKFINKIKRDDNSSEEE